MDKEATIFDYLVIIFKWKKTVLLVFFGMVAVAFIVSLLMSPVYEAETRIIIPPVGSVGVTSDILSQLGGDMAGILGQAMGLEGADDLYAGMLRSRTIYDRIIERFSMMDVYEAEYREEARKRLDEYLHILREDNGILTITVEDHDPERAADLANAFVRELDVLTNEVAVTEASKRRHFYERELERIKEKLTEAEESLRSFQKDTGVIKMDDQAEAVIEYIAGIKSQIAAREVELKVMRTYATPSNPDLQKLEEGLEGMKEQLADLEEAEKSQSRSIIATERIANLGTDYIRKVRDLKYFETLFEVMAKQYELARMDEARHAMVVQVLDEAVVPEKEAGPKKVRIVIAAAFGGFILALFAAFFREFADDYMRDAGNREAYERLRKHLKLS